MPRTKERLCRLCQEPLPADAAAQRRYHPACVRAAKDRQAKEQRIRAREERRVAKAALSEPRAIRYCRACKQQLPIGTPAGVIYHSPCRPACFWRSPEIKACKNCGLKGERPVRSLSKPCPEFTRHYGKV
jgi:hypothetical protein